MPLHEFPKCYDDIKELFESYAQLVKDNRRLKALVDSGLGGATKTKGQPKTSSGGSSSSSGWSTAPSVTDVEKMKSKSKPKPKPKPTQDSDDDSPLPRKGEPHVNGKGAKTTGKKRPAPDDNEGPKPPKKRSAYNLFMGVRNSELQKILAEKGIKIQNNTDRSELLTKVGKEWREMADQDKTVWQSKADKMNSELLAEYEAKHGNSAMLEDSDDE